MAIATFFNPTVSLHSPAAAAANNNGGPLRRPPASSQPPPLLRLRLRLSPASPASLATHQGRPPLHVALCSGAGDGGRFGGDGGHSGGGGGGGGDGGFSSSGGGDNAGGKNEEEALMVLAEAGRGVESLPGDLAAALGAGKIPGSVVTRSGLNVASGSSPRPLRSISAGGEKFFDELEIVFADVVMAILADFMLVYLPAPTVSLRPALATDAGSLAKFFYSCPDNAFQIALPGISYSFLQRIGSILRNGTKLFAVGTASSLVGTFVTNALINARKAVDNSSAEVENVPILSTSAAYGVYMAVSSNLRYQVLAGVIEQRMLEPLLHQHKLMLSAICFAVRTGNTFLGSLLWVDYARWIGIQ
ncbi:hypothetical protein NL676_031404 [Syzygium grande]|nr:hypothetical protein NL676_031404 [Syzygium grande]